MVKNFFQRLQNLELGYGLDSIMLFGPHAIVFFNNLDLLGLSLVIILILYKCIYCIAFSDKIYN